MTYTLKDDEKVVLKYYEESIEPTSAYIEVLKSSVVTENSSAFIKAKLVNGKDLDGTKDYIINGDQFIKEDVNVHDLKIDNLPLTRRAKSHWTAYNNRKAVCLDVLIARGKTFYSSLDYRWTSKQEAKYCSYGVQESFLLNENIFCQEKAK